MTRKQKIVLIGAGSLQFGLGSVGSILKSEVLKGSTICLLDKNIENLNLAVQACQAAINKKKLDFSLEYTDIRKDALKNATFVVNSIEVPPRFELWEMDYEIPRKFGNKQIYGENGGPGGLFHSLRIIPPILEICEDIQKISPNALFINYSNPMSRICLAIKRKYPKLKFVGLCHEIKNALMILPKILNTPLSNIEFKAGGLNHFGVVLTAKFRDSGKDAYPVIRQKAPGFLKNLNRDVDLIRNILEIYGYLPYTTDSHYGEYIGWAWEKANLKGVQDFYRDYKEITLYAGKNLRRLIKKGEKVARLVKPDDESAVPIIEGILTDSNHVEFSVNLPNDNIITNLLKDLVIECPAIVNKNGVHAIKLGEYPKGLAALLRTEASVQDLVVEAVLKRSKKIALQALLADPNINSQDQAIKILDEMLKLQGSYFYLE